MTDRHLKSLTGIFCAQSEMYDLANMIANRWHQDVKPANILVFSGNSSSPYDCHFKIADLGLAHFKPSIPQATDPLDFDAFGTRAYGNQHTQIRPFQID